MEGGIGLEDGSAFARGLRNIACVRGYRHSIETWAGVLDIRDGSAASVGLEIGN